MNGTQYIKFDRMAVIEVVMISVLLACVHIRGVEDICSILLSGRL